MLRNWLVSGAAVEGHPSILLWLVRATVLSLLTAIVAGIVQRRSADLAHRVWIAALACVLLLPIFTMIFPSWALDIHVVENHEPASMSVPVHGAPATILGEGNPNSVSNTEKPEHTKAPALPATPQGFKDAAYTGATTPQNLGVSEHDSPTERAAMDWLGTIGLVWGLIAAVLLVRLVGAFLLLAQLVGRASAAGVELVTNVADTARLLGVHQRCDVRILPAGSMPMACWLGRWIVLLPEDFLHWPIPLRSTVIAHELGHLARRDAWWDLLTQFVCRAFWPNPVMWLASRAVPRLRERACDEWVLATETIDACDYAQHLLEVSARCASSPVAFAPGMARAADLERRLRSVLAPRFPRWRSPLARLLAVGGCLLLTAVLAAGQLAPKDQEPRAHGEADQQNPRDKAPEISQGVFVVQRTIEPVPLDGPAISVGGAVVTSAGKAVPGANVILRAKIGGRGYGMGLMHNRDVLAQTKTDAQGRFAFEKIGIPPRLAPVIHSLLGDQGGAEILSWADGLGMTWTDVNGIARKDPIRLVLVPEAKVTGMVRDKTGKGVPNVRINVYGVTRAVAQCDPFFHEPGDLNLALSEVALAATSDNEGRFTLSNMPVDYRCSAIILGAGFSRQVLFIDTGDNKKLTEMGTAHGGESYPVQRSPVNVSLEPQRLAKIKVVDQIGKPIGDGVVQLIDSELHFAGWGEVSERGEAQIAIRKPGRYRLQYGADPLQPRLSASLSVMVLEGEAPTVVEMRVPEPTWFSGRVIDGDTGRAIVGAHVSYRRKSDPKLEDFPTTSVAVSAQDGEFRIPVVPGRGSIGVSDSVFGYVTSWDPPDKKTELSRIMIDVPRSGIPEPVTLRLARGLSIRGLVRDPDGKVVAGVVVQGENEDWPRLRSSATTNAEGRFEMAGLSPHVKVNLIVSGSSSFARATIEATIGHPRDKTLWKDVEIRLKRGTTALTGRVLYKDKPKAGVVMKLTRTIGEKKMYYPAGETKTDARGLYRMDGLEAGDGYLFEIVDADGMADPKWTHQSPWINTIKEGSTEIKLPDIKLITLSQTLRGVVVGTKGNPLAGITVSANLADGGGPGGGIIPRPVSGPPPWTETDREGRFELRQLPDQPIALMAYRANPAGGEILYPSKARPASNQQDISMVIDPSLSEGIEDLDAAGRAKK